jgi:hypothetical protein
MLGSSKHLVCQIEGKTANYQNDIRVLSFEKQFFMHDTGIENLSVSGLTNVTHRIGNKDLIYCIYIDL